MNMLRHYFISDNLDDLEVFEEQLENAGVSTPQIHILSKNDTGVAHHHHLHNVSSFMKQDALHSATQGAVIGVAASVSVLFVAFSVGWTDSAAGWLPFIFLAVILLGFFTWEGGLFGIQKPNHHFRHFERALEEGKHIFFMDLEPGQESILDDLIKSHPKVQLAGTGTSTPHWFIEWQKRVPRFFRETFP